MAVKGFNKWMIVPVMVLVWLLALLYSSGIGYTYDIYGKAKALVVVLSLYQIFVSRRIRNVKKYFVILVAYLIIVNFFTHILYAHDMLDFLWMYLLMWLISMLPVEDGPMIVVSLAYGAMGMLVLYIYNYGTAFSGWNTNSIAMIGFFSFCVAIVGFHRVRDLRILVCLIVYAVLYFVLLEVLNSRGSVLFAIVLLLGIFGILPIQKLMCKPGKILLILLIPLIVAGVIVVIRNAGFVEKLEVWSRATFQKPIFNGRDELWYSGFMQLMKHPLFGNGNLSAANWHNSAVTMLVGGGLVGYCVWVTSTKRIMSLGAGWISDKIVLGLMMGILGIWLQQTVELGLVSGQVNAIPYAMMGLLLGRVRTLEGRKNGM